ncbi:MAG: RICIN domain-containing protein, partial [Polyangia bacterium]
MEKQMRVMIGWAGASLLVSLLAGCAMQAPDGISSSKQDVTCIGCGEVGSPGGTLAPEAPAITSGGTFTVHALGNMCLDFGGQAYWAAGAPVTLYWCNGTIAQELDVQEVAGAGHDVTLHVGTGTDNNYCIGARGGQPVAGAV